MLESGEWWLSRSNELEPTHIWVVEQRVCIPWVSVGLLPTAHIDLVQPGGAAVLLHDSDTAVPVRIHSVAYHDSGVSPGVGVRSTEAQHVPWQGYYMPCGVADGDSQFGVSNVHKLGPRRDVQDIAMEHVPNKSD